MKYRHISSVTIALLVFIGTEQNVNSAQILLSQTTWVNGRAYLNGQAGVKYFTCPNTGSTSLDAYKSSPQWNSMASSEASASFSNGTNNSLSLRYFTDAQAD